MNKFKELFSQTVIFAIGNFLTKLILFFLMPLYTSVLSVEQYGIADLMTSSVDLVLPILTLCISDAVFRFSIDEDADKEQIFSSAICLVIKNLLIAIIISFILNLFFAYKYYIYIILLYITACIKHLFAQFARGIGFIKIFTVSGVVGSIALVLINIILLLGFECGIEGYLIAIISSNIISSLYLSYSIKINRYFNITLIDKQLLKSMLKFSIPNVPNMLSWWINNMSSRYIILSFCGQGMAGMFVAASKIPALINLFSSIFQQAWQYSSSKEYGKDECDEFYTEVFKYYSIFILIVCSGIMLLSPYISKFILLGEFYKAWTYIPLLLVSSTLGCYSVFFGTFYMTVKDNRMAMVSTIVGAIVNVLICFILIPIIKIYGSLIASVISYLVITLIRVIDTRKYIRIEASWGKIIFNLVIIFFQAIALTISFPYAKTISLILFMILLATNLKDLLGIIKSILTRYFFRTINVSIPKERI